MSTQGSLGRIGRSARARRRLTPVRLLLPLGWLLAAVGYFGPWIAHRTAGLALSGVDLAEFVKFLPGVRDGTLEIVRQFFYLPPLAVVVTIAVLIESRRLHLAWPLKLAMLALAVPVSLQLLPPAWSPASLTSSEFLLQTLALGFCWLLLAGFWLLGRLPARFSGLLSAVLALAGGVLSGWQLLLVKPAIDQVYHAPPALGWGFFLSLLGLATIVIACVVLVARSREPGMAPR